MIDEDMQTEGARPALPRERKGAGAREGRDSGPVPPPGAIVPARDVASNALLAVIAIMAFLAALAVGVVSAVWTASETWRADVAREVTIQLRPSGASDMDASIGEALQILRAFPGVDSARALGDDELGALLEPWLGAVDLDLLPVPGLVAVTLSADRPADLSALATALSQRVPGVSLDDHDVWQRRLAIMSRTLVLAAIGVMALVMAATVLSIAFATRGAMATNQHVVQVLHLVGAKERFIAEAFARNFLWLGLKAGAIGGAAALALFAVSEWLAAQFVATPVGLQIEALFGAFEVSRAGYAAIVVIALVVAGLTGLTARLAVQAVLRDLG